VIETFWLAEHWPRIVLPDCSRPLILLQPKCCHALIAIRPSRHNRFIDEALAVVLIGATVVTLVRQLMRSLALNNARRRQGIRSASQATRRAPIAAQ
jgi:hypothetical protein